MYSDMDDETLIMRKNDFLRLSTINNKTYNSGLNNGFYSESYQKYTEDANEYYLSQIDQINKVLRERGQLI